MNQDILNRTVSAFNNRNFSSAVAQSAEGLAESAGPDEAFWLGLHEACEGFELLASGKLVPAEKKLMGSMRTMRNFGFRFENFEVTAALAGIRRAVEEIRTVRVLPKKVFDMSLLPQLRLAAKADD